MRKVYLICLVLFICSFEAFGSVDYKCAQDCEERGYLHRYCQQLCSYESVTSGLNFRVPAKRGFLESVIDHANEELNEEARVKREIRIARAYSGN